MVACGEDRSALPAPLPAARARALTAMTFERTPARVERGRYLANAVIGCVICHSERDTTAPGAPPRKGREYGGAVIADEPGYRVIAPNLTPDVETGAGGWTDDMLARAIREGVGHDGRALGGLMWWWSFRFLADEDLASIIVYLRSLPPVRNALPPRILSADQERERAARARPLTTPVPVRDLSDPVERGRYLIDIADCSGCHSAWEAKFNPGIFAGGNRIERLLGTSVSANLTPDPAALGGWSEEAFATVVRTGKGGTLHPAMPWVAYRHMTDEDLRAIFLALRQTPPVRHLVNNLAPPTDCVVCGQAHGLGEFNVAPVYARVDVDLGPLDAYVGRYRVDDMETTITTRAGVLFAAQDGGPEIELIPVADGRFAGRGLVAPLAFERGADGRIAALVSFELGPARWEVVR